LTETFRQEVVYFLLINLDIGNCAGWQRRGGRQLSTVGDLQPGASEAPRLNRSFGV
jgi:hypothetical protein